MPQFCNTSSEPLIKIVLAFIDTPNYFSFTVYIELFLPFIGSCRCFHALWVSNHMTQS